MNLPSGFVRILGHIIWIQDKVTTSKKPGGLRGALVDTENSIIATIILPIWYWGRT